MAPSADPHPPSDPVFHDYAAYGLTVRSALPLSQFASRRLPPGAAPQVRVELCDVARCPMSGDPGRGIVRFDETEAVFYSGDLGWFFVTGGESIRFYPLPQADPLRAAALITGTLMATLLHQRGFFVVHASVVECAGGAIAFAGLAGTGKSSMAAACCQAGRLLLADDTAAVDCAGGQPVVMPGAPAFRLDPQSIGALAIPPDRLYDLHSLDPGKLGVRMDHCFLNEPRVLRALYLLDFADDVSIGPVSRQEALVRLIPHVFPTRWMMKDSGAQLARLAEFVRLVPVFRLLRRSDLDRLPLAAAAAQAHAAALPAP
ncbi:MAG: hypothetical protein M1457_11840 [bacterium]|nr:hypothetical protein [bacterium]